MSFNILKDRVVAQKIGMSRSSIWAKINPKSTSFDPSFPQPVSTGLRATGWIEDELDAWLMTQANKRQQTEGGPTC